MPLGAKLLCGLLRCVPAAPLEPVHAHSEHHQDWREFIENGVSFTNLAGATLLIGQVVISAVNTLRLISTSVFGGSATMICPINREFAGKQVTVTAIRACLGSTIAYALQLLVVADVLDTMAEPVHLIELETILKLMLICGLREALAFVMEKEVSHLMHTMHAKDAAR